MQVLNQIRTKVNGRFLSAHNGQPITILGKVEKVHSNGSIFELMSTDNQIITVVLNEPLNENLEGWVEVRGNGQGRSNVMGQQVIQLNDIIDDDSFDPNLYNDLINVINSTNNPWISEK